METYILYNFSLVLSKMDNLVDNISFLCEVKGFFMKTGRILVFCISMLMAHAGLGQTTRLDKQLIVYDPIFWKNDLKLSTFQCRKIQNIDIEYYEHLIAAFRSGDANQSQLQLKVVECLTDRSNRIWETFKPKQKRKWKKIFGEYDRQFSGDEYKTASMIILNRFGVVENKQ